MNSLVSRTGGIARWSLHHPVAVVMLTLAALLVGLFALTRLQIDLLPHIIYPSIGVRVNDPGVPAPIMEDEVTRQLEEQLAITEDAVHVRSATRRGRSAVDIDFAYGTDMDAALRDAATRLDRARRFLPDSVEPPVIYKRDPSQLPAMELAVHAPQADPVALRQWVDYTLSKWLINVPGVAAAEVAGGLRRQIQVLADPLALAGHRLDITDLAEIIEDENRDWAGGRLPLPTTELPVQTSGRLQNLDQLARLPLPVTDGHQRPVQLPLAQVARIHDGHEPARLRIRLDGEPAVKVSIQKQPQANTVQVVDAVEARLTALEAQGIIPAHIQVTTVNDEARHIRRALHNAATAALGGGLLAMVVVWLFLGDLGRTLIIGSAIPIALAVTLALMAAGGLTLNLMTLGGLALGIGMLVDSTIVMLENIQRHQRRGESPIEAAETATAEVTSAIVAATSTNLAAVLPFLFVGGLIGLLFDELILTLSAAMVAAMVVALTLVPALAGRLRPPSRPALMERLLAPLEAGYARLLARLLPFAWLVLLLFLGLLVWKAPALFEPLARFLPKIDDGRVSLYLTADRDTRPEEMDRITRRIEALLMERPEVVSLFTTVGGFTFGRSTYESPNRANIKVQLRPPGERPPLERWIGDLRKTIAQQQLAGVKVRIRQRGIRGLRLGRGDDDLSFHIQGPDLATLEALGRRMRQALAQVPGLRNLKLSNEEQARQLDIQIDRQKARQLGLDTETIGKAVRYALEGLPVGRFLDGDHSIQIRLRLAGGQQLPQALERLILMGGPDGRTPVRLGQVARIHLSLAPATILREQQQRIVELTASLAADANLSETLAQARRHLAELELPPGYHLYDGGTLERLQEGQATGHRLLALALFLVLVAMAVQYESLRAPLVILFSVAFGLIGVALGLEWTDTPLSMPVWLGLIMLAGILVNNAILLVEYMEQGRRAGRPLRRAITRAARLRLRPILMTTLTTLLGMLPLALDWGQGAEMLQPLAITLISGLSFSLLVTLLLVPATYWLAMRPRPAGGSITAQ